jgi:hypothetical protein
MYIKEENNNCKCCGGRGTQFNHKTGLTVHCPCCLGTGKENNFKKDRIIWEGKPLTGNLMEYGASEKRFCYK